MVPSNKPIKQKKKHLVIKPKVSRPKIDKISVCLPIEDAQECEDIERNLRTELKSPDRSVSYARKKYGYRTGAKLHFLDDDGDCFEEHLLFLCHPVNSSLRFVRCEWNPSFISDHGIHLLKNALNCVLLHGYEQLFYSGNCTRIDVAVDIAGVHAEDILCLAKRMRTRTIYVGQDRRLETTYHGQSRSNQVVLYDRKKHLQNTGVHKTPSKLTRVEFRLKNQGQVTELSNIKNPFNSFDVFKLSAKAFPGASWVTPFFRDSCRIRGLKRALELLPAEHRKIAKNVIEKSKANWLDPEALWSKWPWVLKDAGLTSDALGYAPEHIKNHGKKP